MKRAVFFFLFLATSLFAVEGLARELSTGQTLYVPAYSHIFGGDREHPFYLTVTLSIRNVNLTDEISLDSVEYVDSEGNRVRSYLEKPETLSTLGSRYYVIKESDTAGGVGAHFLVRWSAAHAVNPPVVQAVMIGTKTQQGISFTTSGRVVVEAVK